MKHKYTVVQESNGPDTVGIVHEDDFPAPMVVFSHEDLWDLVLFMHDEKAIKAMFSRCNDTDILQRIDNRFGITF